MNYINKKPPIKAIILAAGVGSRIRPLTDNCPKSLLMLDGKTILEMMISSILACGIKEIIIVLGYLPEQIRTFITTNFPDVDVTYIYNERYEDTNTGFSLMLTKEHIGNSAFIKFDADVVFARNILSNLINIEYENCLCIDKNIQLEAEEVKVILKGSNKVFKANKLVDPAEAAGESIGIEKISNKTAIALFAELNLMMKDKNNYQAYYEAAYERLIDKNILFHAMDITGLKWIEIDTLEDYNEAKSICSS